jgi:hypothetical protein
MRLQRLRKVFLYASTMSAFWPGWRGRADVGEAKPLEKRADMALVILDAETLLDDALEIDASPAHYAVDLSVGASFDERREFGFLNRREARRWPLRPIGRAHGARRTHQPHRFPSLCRSDSRPDAHVLIPTDGAP